MKYETLWKLKKKQQTRLHTVIIFPLTINVLTLDVTAPISVKPVSFVCISTTYQFFENGKIFNCVWCHVQPQYDGA